MSSLMAPLYYSLLFTWAKKYTGYRWGWVNIDGISWFFLNTQFFFTLNIVSEVAEVGGQGWHAFTLALSRRWVNSWRTKSRLISQTCIIQSHIHKSTCTHILPHLFNSQQNLIQKCGLNGNNWHLAMRWRPLFVNYSCFMWSINHILWGWYVGCNCA